VSKQLTRGDWDAMVKAEVLPAYTNQLPPDFGRHADWVFSRITEDKWSLEKTRWAICEVTRSYRTFDNLLAMLEQVADGKRTRDGDKIGGWEQSKEYRVLIQYQEDKRQARDCATLLADGLRDRSECGKYPRCQECHKLAEKQPRQSVRSGETYQPRTAGEIAAQAVKGEA